jgi:UDP-N-acetylmuramoyl-L-alanyl-D-glutamate--2,6-diaminopimelate ligase
VTVIVDYAHTPDALENVLKTINDIRTKNEQLITLLVVVEIAIKPNAQ